MLKFIFLYKQAYHKNVIYAIKEELTKRTFGNKYFFLFSQVEQLKKKTEQLTNEKIQMKDDFNIIKDELLKKVN